MEVLYNILIEFGVPKKLVGLIKMCLSETIHVGKRLSDSFLIIGLENRDYGRRGSVTLAIEHPSFHKT
jgi:hypothetical protein